MKEILKEEKKLIESFDYKKYDRPSVSVDVVLFRIKEEASENYRKLSKKSLQVFLVSRQNIPYKGIWALPGSFLDMNVSLEESAMKCINEKIGAKNFYIEQLYTFGSVERDPRIRVISTSYLAITNNYNEKLANNGAWFDLTFSSNKDKNGVETFYYNLKNGNDEFKSVIRFDKEVESDFAFDHSLIIHQAVQRLRNKIEYTSIAFSFLPEKFTLTNLQEVYEIILNKPLLTANFRRKTAALVKDAGEITSGMGHRAARLFSYNGKEQSNF